MFYIYALLDPETKYTKYIGKTSDPSKRLAEHIKTSKNAIIGTKKEKWIKSLLKKNLVPEVTILEDNLFSEIQTNAVEIFHISQALDLGFDLTNHTIGGEDPPHYKGEEVSNSKLTSLDVIIMRKYLNSGKSLKEVSDIFPHVTKQCILLAATGNSWAHIEEPVFKPRKKVKLTDEDVLQIRKLLREGNLNQPQIAKRFNVTQSTVSDIKRNKRRKNIQLTTKSVV